MFRNSLLIAAVMLVVCVAGLRPAGAEDGAARVFATWTADGNVLQTGAVEATLIGTLNGPVFIDTDHGPVAAGDMACAMVVRQDLKNARQTGQGNCTFKGPKGNLWFMTLNCTGVPLVGCSGDSTLTGGTGTFEKVTGGGRFTIRSNMLELAQSPNAEMAGKVKGIIFWPALHYKTP